MPPRHTYWTIILEGKPTAFRAHTRDELLPTFRQLQSRHADIVLMWFARGRLWESPEAALAALRRRRIEKREPGWRPGGAHRDPRDRFKLPRDEKRRRFGDKRRRDVRHPASSEAPAAEKPPNPADRRHSRVRPHASRKQDRGRERRWEARPRNPGGGGRRGGGGQR